MKKTSLYIIITILLMAIASGTTYIILNNNYEKNNKNIKESDKENNNKEQDNQPTENIKPETITLKEEELKKYLSYIPNGDYLNNNEFITGAYNQSNINLNNINKNLFLAKAIKLNDENYNYESNQEIKMNSDIMCEAVECVGDNATTKNYYPLTFINSKLKEMYNYELTDLQNAATYEDTLNIGGMCYYYDNGNFIKCGGGNSTISTKASLLDSYEATSDELIIYEYAANFYLNNDPNGSSLWILEDYYNNHKIEIKDKNIDSSYANKYLEKYKNDFKKYKHTFKKNSLGYYWYSTEVVD